MRCGSCGDALELDALLDRVTANPRDDAARSALTQQLDQRTGVRFFGVPARAPPQSVWSNPVPQGRLDAELHALVQLCVAEPEDDARRLVLADAWSEHGDARGEFITLQIAEARQPPKAERTARIAALLRAFSASWVPPGVEPSRSTFRRGFLHRAAWFGATATEHWVWPFVRHLAYRPMTALPPWLEGLERLHLESISEAPRNILLRVLEAPPPGLRSLEGSLLRTDLDGSAGQQLGRVAGLHTLALRFPFVTLSLAELERDLRLVPQVSHLRLIDVWGPLEAMRRSLARRPSSQRLEVVCEQTEEGTLSVDVHPSGLRVLRSGVVEEHVWQAVRLRLQREGLASVPLFDGDTGQTRIVALS